MDLSLLKRLEQLSEDISDLCLPVCDRVPELAAPPSPLEFLRDWCAPNRPFVVRGAARCWTATRQWTPAHFRQHYGQKEVTVAVTPDGYADAIEGEFFALPEERVMTMAKFMDILDEPERFNGVHYVQRQNSNLSRELPELFADVPEDVTWMTDALGQPPDAVNFWMGDGRAVTSLHKDHYENVYYVLRGYKELVLLPPVDRLWLPHRLCTPATYREKDGVFCLEPDWEAAPVPWADWDPVTGQRHTTAHAQRQLSQGHQVAIQALTSHAENIHETQNSNGTGACKGYLSPKNDTFGGDSNSDCPDSRPGEQSASFDGGSGPASKDDRSLAVSAARYSGASSPARDSGATSAARDSGACTAARDSGATSAARDSGPTSAARDNGATSAARDSGALAACDSGATSARNSDGTSARDSGGTSARDSGASSARDSGTTSARDSGATSARDSGALPDSEIAPRLHQLHCRLEAGDMLYLPSLWFHHLRQSHGCVAVNYWYDMQYDLKYCYFKFLESLAET